MLVSEEGHRAARASLGFRAAESETAHSSIPKTEKTQCGFISIEAQRIICQLRPIGYNVNSPKFLKKKKKKFWLELAVGFQGKNSIQQNHTALGHQC